MATLAGNTPAPRFYEPDVGFIKELRKYGAETFQKCYQCATCTVSCGLSSGESPYPRKEMLWTKWGFKDKLLKDLDVWACYYCGDCSAECPREAEPGETMMALRRYATSRYDWTGISRFLYTSWVREVLAVLLVGLAVVGLFWWSGAFSPERMPTDHVSVETFIPHEIVHYGDWVMAAVLSFFLLTNSIRMWRMVMDGEKVPPRLYLAKLKTFFLHFATQKRWRECGGEDHSRWFKHFLFVPAYAGMLVLVMFFLAYLQVDTSRFTWVSFIGYYITFILLWVSGDAIVGRLRKREQMHRHSHESDWMFLVLLFLTALTGIMMHLFRMMDWALATYYIYVIHLAIAVPMLVLEVPFMKWAHLMYRPLALYLREVKEANRTTA